MDSGDTHSDNFKGTPSQAAVLDQAMGLLDQALVVLGTGVHSASVGIMLPTTPAR